MNCPHCQTHNPVGARFCQNCGAALLQAAFAQAPPVQRCTNCQMELPAGARFCMNCGQLLSKRTPTDDARLSRLTAAAPPPLVDKVHAAAHLAGIHTVSPGASIWVRSGGLSRSFSLCGALKRLLRASLPLLERLCRQKRSGALIPSHKED